MRVFNEVNEMSLNAFDELAAGDSDLGENLAVHDDRAATAVTEPTEPSHPHLSAFRSEKNRQGLLKEFDGVQQIGGSFKYKLLSGPELQEYEPVLTDSAATGVAIFGQRFIDPPRYIDALADSFRKRGATIVTHSTVTSINTTASKAAMRSNQGDSIESDHLVVATVAWLGALSRQFGVKRVVQTGRGYSFTVIPEHMPRHPIYFPTERVARTPLEERFRVTGMMEFRPADAPLETRRIDAIITAVKH